MSKITHNLEQGSDDWLAYRREYFGASEAAAMLGISKHCSRSELLKRKATGIEPEVSPALQAVFDRGHATEIGGREMAEKIIGQPLYPVTMSEGKLSASCDGLTLSEDIAFEHKQYRADLADSVRAGVLPEEYQPQCQQVMMVTGASMLLFMVSDGTPDNCAYMWVEPDSEWRQTIVQGWTQFAIDLANYEPTENTATPVAAPQMALPSVSIQVQGSIALIDNLSAFGEALTDYVERINKKPQTDDDFATLEATVKTLRKAEEALDAAENGALAQTHSIDAMRRTVAMYRDMARSNRLLVDKLVASEKQNRKTEIVSTAMKALIANVEGLNKRLGGDWMPPTSGMKFIEVTKGLKSLDSMRDKVSAALANAKIEANEIADRIEANLKSLKQLGQDHTFLFPDFVSVCTKAQDDFAGLYAIRLSRHRTAEEERIETEREKIRKEEAERITKEAARAGAIAQVQDVIDQRGKADVGVGLSPDGRAQPEAASTAPTPTKRPVYIDEQRIDEFLSLTPMTPAEKKAARINLVKWEKYRLACEHEVMV